MSHVDLHLHSDASDGIVSPTDVVRRAASLGLSGLSLTDHDTVEGLDEAAEEARLHDLRFLPGAELSANEPNRSVHILAFGIDRRDSGLLAFLRTLQEDRRRRARQMVEKQPESPTRHQRSRLNTWRASWEKFLRARKSIFLSTKARTTWAGGRETSILAA